MITFHTLDLREGGIQGILSTFNIGEWPCSLFLVGICYKKIENALNQTIKANMIEAETDPNEIY